eukprot:c23654_g2_i1 orf=264-434(+)
MILDTVNKHNVSFTIKDEAIFADAKWTPQSKASTFTSYVEVVGNAIHTTRENQLTW